MIDVDELRFQYPDGTQALQGVTCRIQSGEFTALIGQNGSGKSTFAKCVSGILDPPEQTVSLEGQSLRSYTQKEVARRIGYVFQNPDHQLFHSTVRAEIASGPRNLGLDPDRVQERVEKARTIAGVASKWMDEHPFFLSRGLRQRVAIASVLAMRPRIIIVDEPTTGQDHRQSLAVMKFLRDLNQRDNHTVLIITHDIHYVARFARRVLLFSEGSLLGEGPPRDIFSRDTMLDRAGIRPPQITQFSQRVYDRTSLTVNELLDYVGGGSD